jgi:hypothetical protein
MSFEPKFDYANASDRQLSEIALAGGRQEFGNLLDSGLLNNDGLFTQFGKIDELDNFVELGREGFGTGWQEFVKNVDPENGKIATVVRYHMDSADAFDRYGEDVGKGPKQWTGGVHLEVSVELDNGETRTTELAGASSGVQGVYDAAVTSAVLRRYAAAWVLREKARAKAAATS